MGKKSTPKPPDLTPLSDAQLEISREQLAQAQQQMGISAQQFDKFMKLSDDEMAQSQKQYDQQMGLQQRALDQADEAAKVSKSVADKQIEAMDQNMQFAQQDRDRYKNVALPLQDKYIADAKAYDTPEREAQAAAQALADNQQQLEAQRANTASQLASMGVDPSQVMSTSLANQIGVAGAAMGAQSANAARLQTQATGRGLIENSINMTNGLPAQSQAGYATATNAANSAAANTNAATSGYSTASGIGATASGIRQNSLNTASSITGSPMAWAQLGNQSYGGASNGIMNASSIQNQMFQNQMSVQKMKDDQSAQTMNAIGSAAGMAAMFMAEGGAVDDYHPTVSADDLRLSPIHIDDMHFQPTAVKSAKLSGMSTKSKVGAGLAIAGQALTAMGNNGQGSGDDPNLGQSWLRPIYRAEGGGIPDMAPTPVGGGIQSMPTTGGVMGGNSGIVAPMPHPYPTPGTGGGGQMSPPVMRANPLPTQNGGFMPGTGGGIAPMPRMLPGSPPATGQIAPHLGMGGGTAPAPRPYQGGAMGPLQRFIGPNYMGPPRQFTGGRAMPMMYAEGGDVPQSRYQVMPNLQSRDKIPAVLAPGEVVIPADVVRVKGQEFFDKLIAKHHRPGS